MLKKLSTKSIVLFIISFAFFVAGICLIGRGYDKKDNYYQSEYFWETSVNAYVGGDAYNYIINGTYFAGYCALGGAMLVAAIIAGVAGVVCLEITENEAKELQEKVIEHADDEAMEQRELCEEQ